MSLTRDEHSVRINGHAVSVTGAKASGRFVLEGELPDGSSVQAFVHQGAFGPTQVAVYHAGEEITRFKGFVA